MEKPIFKFVLNFLKIQLIVTAASLPILACWGIPISLMTFIGNFLFSPFLSVFLFLSTITFFTELLHIPNGIFIKALCATTSLWDTMLSYGSKCWLFGIAQPKKALAILLILLAVVLTLRVTLKIMSKAIMLALIVCTTYFVWHQFTRHAWPSEEVVHKVPRKEKKLRKLQVVQHPDGTIELVDNGLFHKQRSPEKFVMYNLKPYLIKNYGIIKIKKVSISRPSRRTFKVIKELCKTFEVQGVRIV